LAGETFHAVALIAVALAVGTIVVPVCLFRFVYRFEQIRAQCESKVFFPDDPAQRPQFSDCPRRAETTRKVPDTSKSLNLCAKCAKI